jgi:hypothetical protein
MALGPMYGRYSDTKEAYCAHGQGQTARQPEQHTQCRSRPPLATRCRTGAGPWRHPLHACTCVCVYVCLCVRVFVCAHVCGSAPHQRAREVHERARARRAGERLQGGRLGGGVGEGGGRGQQRHAVDLGHGHPGQQEGGGGQQQGQWTVHDRDLPHPRGAPRASLEPNGVQGAGPWANGGAWRNSHTAIPIPDSHPVRCTHSPTTHTKNSPQEP